MNEPSEAPMVSTEFGWALASLTPPGRRDLLWMKMPEQHIYSWDDQGWHRIKPPEKEVDEMKDLPHG